ncbi:MAG TPA: hypothetical protein VFE89_04835 [Beijerinckiaceae bacterium]|jgi:hypothetical protein|nr:hypothetical protein [Beijerinckiaceae bacterium]
MVLVNWLDALFVGMLVVGLAVKFGIRRTQSPEQLGYVFLKQKAAALGVDLNRIPDSAFEAIVDMSVASARDRALRSRVSLAQVDWASTLEEEAMEISKFLQGSPCNRRAAAPHILTEYRV